MIQRFKFANRDFFNLMSLNSTFWLVGMGSILLGYCSIHEFSHSLSAEPDKKRYIKFETPTILYTVVPLATLMEKLEAPALYIWDCDNAGWYHFTYFYYYFNLCSIFTYIIILYLKLTEGFYFVRLEKHYPSYIWNTLVC